VQSEVRKRVPEKVLEKVWEAGAQSQVRFNRVPEKVPDFLQLSHFVASKSVFSYEFSLEHEKTINLKIDVSCEASLNFHHISQNATPATEFAPCRHLTQP